jgi:ABC-2 type transport system permease protein
MKKAFIIARREIAAYFNSPVAYIVLGIFLLVMGLFFFQINSIFTLGTASMRGLFAQGPFLFLFFAPAMTMRLLAEEKRTGTIELLLTWPITDGAVILGKFLAALAFLCIGLALTFPYALTVASLGELDWGPVFGGYLGLVCMGASYLAIGVFASAITTNQIVAFLVSFLLGGFFFTIGKLTSQLAPTLAAWADALSFDKHFQDIARGVIDTRDLAFYLIFVALFLLAAVEALRARRWR